MADITTTKIDDVTENDFDKVEIFQIYKVWRSIPYLMKNPPRQNNGNILSARDFATAMGIEEENLLELIEIKDSKSFAIKYNVHVNTLTKWTKYIKKNGYNNLSVMREWALELSNNLLMSLYNHAMKKGNPLTIKLWFQLVNEWKEQQKVEHTFIPVKSIRHENYEPITNGQPRNSLAENAETESSLQLS